jgi:hypothetical protein
VSLKIKIFLWQLYNRKIQAAMVMKKEAGKATDLVPCVGENKTIYHIFPHCVLAKYVWCCLHLVFGLDPPPSAVDDFLGIWLSLSSRPGGRTIHLFLFAGLFWAMWCNRNRMAIEKMFPNNRTVILYNSIFFM